MTPTKPDPLYARARPLSVEIWVQRLNALAAKIDGAAQWLHPSAWHEQLADLFVEYEALARRPTRDEDSDRQLALEGF